MDAFVAFAPSALGVEGAVLVGLWIKGERVRAAVRLQSEWRARCARRARRHRRHGWEGGWVTDGLHLEDAAPELGVPMEDVD